MSRFLSKIKKFVSSKKFGVKRMFYKLRCSIYLILLGTTTEKPNL